MMIIVAYHLVSGHWRVERAVQSHPMQTMLCTDHLTKEQKRADDNKTPRTKFDVICSPRPVDL
ncbi:hypothetical protein [Beijerinckia sp. L45]|uniref:hypothetical protein n=1 Tax=Beijerinckia sp. L45 TaxID=1641855 RepID=UPI00131B0FAE|nr:hypothetical protein [Beijerinckia sp. L45]